jgi:3-hydroxyisobutyrate dehydrogenase
MKLPKIGWIGLGNMGNPMSSRLLAAGYSLTVYNRDKAKEGPSKALGAQTAQTISQLASASDVIIMMVTDDNATREIFKECPRDEKLYISMSTISPALSKELSGSWTYLDAPVSGSVRQAIDGQLVIMVGGEEAAFQKANPILAEMGKLVMRVGDAGAGNTAKLAINVLLAIQAQGLAEAIAFAVRHGIHTEDLITLINNSALGNPFMKIKGEAILQDRFQAAFSLKNATKDLRLAKGEGLGTPLAETALQTFQEAEPKFGDLDIIAILKEL